MPINRRHLLRSALAAGAAGTVWGTRAGRATEQEQELTWETLPTPALVLDADAFEANLRSLSDYCRRAECGFRPHAKTHKCPEIARRQLESGAAGVSVATVPEAVAMVNAGIRGVLLTSPIVEKRKISRMVDLAAAGGDVMLAVGSSQQVELLSAAAEAAKVSLQLLVDVDVNDRRTGALPAAPAVKIAEQISRSSRLQLRGIQAYSGRASHTVGFEKREQVSREAMALALETRDLFKKAGLDTSILSGGSTGTYNIDSHLDGFTELQVGSYVFMDVGYMGIGSKSGDEVYTDFQPSLTVLTTVVSANHRNLVTVDAGGKSMAASPTPLVKGQPGLNYRRFGDEFGALTAESGQPLPRLGDRVELVVPHCDPTVNLYANICVVRQQNVEAVWEVAARQRLL